MIGGKDIDNPSMPSPLFSRGKGMGGHGNPKTPLAMPLSFSSHLSDLFRRFLELVRPGDGEEYSKTSFLGARVEHFMFIIITQQWNPPEHLMDQTYPIRVIIPSRHDV